MKTVQRNALLFLFMFVDVIYFDNIIYCVIGLSYFGQIFKEKTLSKMK